MKKINEAIFAAGCFWGVQEYFRNLPGVLETKVGYSGGKTKKPTYEEVVYGDTCHFETIEVIYDSSKVPYKKLLDNLKNYQPNKCTRTA